MIWRRVQKDIYVDLVNVKDSLVNGNVENVKHAISSGDCDVNAEMSQYGKQERPLSIAIKNIQEENDNFFQIAQLLLSCKDIDANLSVDYFYTLLEYMCRRKHTTTIGVCR